ncbi:phylloplanin-like [Raphanus sativus]|uniref:Phylloplanin-like n=1 Tax=Raphanus sativus TaxID=3726 RepID=A0A9W3CRN0_RAPSA|nr:phylloplanin-like [Raphanus sativus]
MTMLKNKRITFSLIFVCLVMVSPMAKAQLLGGLGAFSVVGASWWWRWWWCPWRILGLINIQGVLRCSANGNVSAPAFVNAGVQLQCGGQNNVVSTATTNGAGLFSMLVNPIQLVLSQLLSDCQVAVTTPLATCNAALPTGQLLSSPLALVGETVSGLLRVANLRPTGFTLAN